MSMLKLLYSRYRSKHKCWARTICQNIFRYAYSDKTSENFSRLLYNSSLLSLFFVSLQEVNVCDIITLNYGSCVLKLYRDCFLCLKLDYARHLELFQAHKPDYFINFRHNCVFRCPRMLTVFLPLSRFGLIFDLSRVNLWPLYLAARFPIL